MYGVSDPKLKFTSYQHEMMEGLIFSDGYIRGKPSPAFRFVQTTKRLEYVDFVKKELEFTTSISYHANATNGGYSISKCNIAFKKYRERWYPEDKKIIPKDFKLTPTSALHLYLGDGCYVVDWGQIVLFTNAFTKENVEDVFLPQLHKINVEAWMVKVSNSNSNTQRWKVYIPKRSGSTFLKYIGPCPIKYFKYKWNRDA